MSKLEFLKELEGLLQDISSEERESAIQYYQDYFEDAGPDSEEAVIEELVSPERVAAIIKNGISNANSEEIGGEYTEKGYIENDENKAKYEVVAEVQSDYSKENLETEESTDHSSNNYNNNNGYNNTSGYTDDYEYTDRNNKNTRDSRKESNIILIILLCLFGIPIGLPFLITAFALAFSMIVTI